MAQLMHRATTYLIAHALLVVLASVYLYECTSLIRAAAF